MSKVYYISELGSFYTIVKHGQDGKFYVKSTPALDGYLINFDRMEFTHIGYMGNDPNGFEKREEAEAFIKGMKFMANL